MLFDNLFGLMTPMLTVTLLGVIVLVSVVVTVGYLMYERDNKRCRLMTYDYR